MTYWDGIQLWLTFSVIFLYTEQIDQKRCTFTETLADPILTFSVVSATSITFGVLEMNLTDYLLRGLPNKQLLKLEDATIERQS